MTTPKIGNVVSVNFRTDGNGKRVKTLATNYKIESVYTDKDRDGNPKVKLDNGDVFYVRMTDKGWIAVL